ncbi:DUF6447 family protein [Prochlorococcus marinus]|uniref:DUF6447 family protein n=1 Tax=Prochlorococcus TaxID=1218 RepID=UPI0007B3BF0A|nr:DUF6447 family protein [Prochlorococcus marinus]
MSEPVANTKNSVFTFRGKRYDLNSLPQELKDLVQSLRQANAQVRKHNDTLKVLVVGRQRLSDQLNEKLNGIPSLSDPA